LNQGWEMRSLQEFHKLAKTHLNRVLFLIVFKLALQMNLQITFIIIQRVQILEHEHNTTHINIVGVISIMSLLLTCGSELSDVRGVARIFVRVKNEVKATAFRLGNRSDPYAYSDFRDENQNIQRIIFSGKDLKEQYYCAARTFWKIILLIIFCMWLTGYALLKLFMAFLCPHGAWALDPGCLDPSDWKPQSNLLAV